MSKTRLATVLLLLVPVLATAQTHQHKPLTNNPNLIDGSQHPEQITDRKAFQLWALALTAPTENPMTPKDEHERFDAFLQNAGFSEGEVDAVMTILKGFATDYCALVKRHNDLLAQGKTDPNFIATRNALTDAARTAVYTHTPFREKLDAFFSQEKHHMAVDKEDK